MHISEVARGRACECDCPECSSALVAKKGGERDHHFSHLPPAHLSNCKGALESALHKYAKALIEEAGYLVLPSLNITLPPPDTDLNFSRPARRIEFTKVTLEERVANGRRRCDVVGYVGAKRILIEICVGHPVSDSKLKDIRGAKESMIEIVVPKTSLFSSMKDGEGSLKDAILDSSENKYWLHFSKQDEILDELRRLAIARKPASTSPQGKVKSSSWTPLVPEKITSEPFISSPPQFRRSNEMPSRAGLNEEEYVRELHEFLMHCQYSKETWQRVVAALELSGNITETDKEIAGRLGIQLNSLD